MSPATAHDRIPVLDIGPYLAGDAAAAVRSVAISIGFGMIPLVSPNFFKQLPHDLHPLLESGILLSALVAVTLNAFFNGVGSKTAAEAGAATAAATATH